MQSVIKGYDSFYAKLSGPINIPGSIQMKCDDKNFVLLALAHNISPAIVSPYRVDPPLVAFFL